MQRQKRDLVSNQDIKAFEDLLASQKIDEQYLREMYGDLARTMDLIEAVVDGGKVLEKEETGQFFLEMVSKKIETVVNGMPRDMGESLLYAWVSTGRYHSLRTALEQMQRGGVKLGQRCFVEAFLREIIPAANMASSVLTLLTRAEEEIILLEYILNELMGFWVHDDQSEEVIFNTLVRRVYNPILDVSTTALENLIQHDKGVGILLSFQHNRYVFHAGKSLAQELMRKVERRSLLRMLSERRAGNALILSWISSIEGFLFFLSKQDLSELIEVLWTIQLQDIAIHQQPFFEALVTSAGEDDLAISFWVKHERAKMFLQDLLDGAILGVKTDAMLRVQLSLKPEFATGVDKLKIIFKSADYIELFAKLLTGNAELVGDGKLFKSLEEVMDCALMVIEEENVMPLYHFAQESNTVKGLPILSFMLKHKKLLAREDRIQSFAQALLAKNTETNACAIDVLLEYESGRECFKLLNQEIPMLLLALLGVDKRAMHFFVNSLDGLDCFRIYIDNMDPTLTAHGIVVDAMAYQNEEGLVPFAALVMSQLGIRTWAELMKKNPQLFTLEPYTGIWLSLLSTSHKSSINNGFTGSQRLSLFPEGAEVFLYILQRLPAMVFSDEETFFSSMTDIVNEDDVVVREEGAVVSEDDLWWHGYSAMTGLAIFRAGVEVIYWVLTKCPGIFLNEGRERLKNALTSRFYLKNKEVTPLSLFLEPKSRALWMSLVNIHPNFYRVYKEDFLEAACVSSRGSVRFIKAIFSVFIVEPDKEGKEQTLLTCFLNEYWILQELAKRLGRHTPGLVLLEDFWTVMVYEIRKGVSVLSRFSKSEELFNLFEQFFRYSVAMPLCLKEKVWKILTVKNPGMDSVMDRILTYEKGEVTLKEIMRENFKKHFANWLTKGTPFLTQHEMEANKGSLSSAGLLKRRLSGRMGVNPEKTLSLPCRKMERTESASSFKTVHLSRDGSGPETPVSFDLDERFEDRTALVGSVWNWAASQANNGQVSGFEIEVLKPDIIDMSPLTQEGETIEDVCTDEVSDFDEFSGASVV